jgi:hypothetical protein
MDSLLGGYVEGLHARRSFAQEFGSAEQVSRDTNALEPEMQVLFIGPANAAMNLRRYGGDLATDFRNVGENVTCQKRSLLGERIEAMRCVPEQ